MNTSRTGDDESSPEARRSRSPRGQGERLRAEILGAVARLLDEQVRHPDLSLSLREVARETGIATQSVYLHFASKESLAWAVAADGYDRLVAAMREAERTTAGSAADRLRVQAHVFWRFAKDNRGVFRLMFGHDLTRLDPDDAQKHPGGLLWHQWIDAVRACEAEGHVRPEEAEQVALHLWSGLLGRFALWSTTFGRDDAADPAAFTDYLVDRTLAGSTTKGPR
ncbi:TetR/AcrR family transcriptional regulator [Amycolatopsis balhimycina DSM 5908]|uniref:TetR/AcrR family transcriptional regulator n=1 Tax=Amycolatopsis balhimycina DSM 5908 TaxID=1081091 RepID=A0A428WRZ4_AMYBA|nr:TetR/AcrR family transcriptional regulator [Amycolatopsis balhimycina]RSM45803.1 TetR/AcrR family transcriptional regulator [Amycolatopsis balhimycina DSM 5908]